MARARTDERNVLSELSDIIDMMRSKGVIKLTWEGTEILMGPPLAKASRKEDADPRAAKRAHYLNLLGTAKTDAELDLLP